MMSKVIRLIQLVNRARKKPLKFVVWKAAHMALGQVEKIKLKIKPELYSLNKLMDDLGVKNEAELVSYIERDAFRFFMPLSNPVVIERYSKFISDHYPDACQVTINKADQITEHVFDLLGSGPTALGPNINWHQDFKTGMQWPPQYHKDIEYNNLDKPSDVKVPWELSRFQHYITLGKAYWYTGDEKYAIEFIDQFNDWVKKNPVGMSVNWSCTMDVALRAINWIWAYRYFSSSPNFTHQQKIKFIYSLANHGAFIIRNLELSDVNGNHYLSDGAGLVYVGLLFGGKEGEKWFQKGWEIVTTELPKQITADGVDFEQSVPYHRLCTELFLYSLMLGEKNGVRLTDESKKRIQCALEYILKYTKPDGSIPLIGDADDGRIHILADQPINDHRYLLSTGAVIFNRPDFKAGASHFWEESFWLTGFEGSECFQQLATEQNNTSKDFPLGGFFIQRTESCHLIVDCGDVGLAGRGGHGHNDILSFELYANGRTWISDSGAYLYTASPYWRNQFRSSPYHNVLTVDGEELARLGSESNLWTIQNDALPLQKLWMSNEQYDIFIGSHKGYDRLASPVSHTRSIVFDKMNEVWLIRDEVEGIGKREVQRYLNLEPDVSLYMSENNMILLKDEQGRLLRIEKPAAENVQVAEGWVSYTYGVKTPRQRLVFNSTVTLPYTLEWLISYPSEELSSLQNHKLQEIKIRMTEILNQNLQKA